MKIKTLVWTALCGAGVVGMLPMTARAATISVTNTNDAGAGSLRAAIETANAQTGDDTIDLSQVKDTIEIASALPDLSTNMSLVGPGANVLKIQRKVGASVPKFRLFTIGNGTNTGPVVSLSGIKLFNGGVTGLGEEGKGGAIYSHYSTLTVKACVLVSNIATQGGGLHCIAGKVAVYDTSFTGNSARIGGGVDHNASDLSITGCTFSHNSAGDPGIGYSDGFGGGIFSAGALEDSKLSVMNSTFSGNVAGEGGGLRLDSRATFLVNSTITDNRAMKPASGGGVFVTVSFQAQSYKIGSCLIANNPQGDDVHVDVLPGVTGDHSPSLGYNLIGTGAGKGQFAATGDQVQAGDPKIGPLQDNGGPTWTHLPASDSPVIDKGQWFGGIAIQVDQRGKARNVDLPQIANAQGNKGTDIGAVEVAAPSGPPVIIRIPPIKLPPQITIPPIGPLNPGPR